MKRSVIFFVLLLFICFGSSYSKSINVDDPSLFKSAFDFLNTQADYDTMILTQSGGLYTTNDTLFFRTKQPITILAAPGLAEKPIITHSDDSTSVLEIIRVHNDLTIEGCVLDGGHPQSHGMKYAIRVGNGPDWDPTPVKKGVNITLRNCDFKNFMQDKDPTKSGHAVYFLKDINTVGTVRIENCTFENFNDEAIRMTETEKYATTRCLDSLIVRNCTFTNMQAECVRFYADADVNTEDAYVLVENLTVNNSCPRVMYIKNNAGTQVRNIIVTNARLSVIRADRNTYIIQVQGVGSHISHVDTLNMVFTNPDELVVNGTKEATEDLTTLWGFDPMYTDAENLDYTLLPQSHAYYSGLDGQALGDLNWALLTPTVIPFYVTVDGNGEITYDPPKDGQVYDPGTVVTMTAVPDSGWSFSGWSGDLSGTNNPATVTVDAAKNISATFTKGSTDVVENSQMPISYSLGQNYPNPFNPSTSIPFTLKKSGMAKLEVYDVLGQKVSTVFNRNYKSGSHRAFFSAEDLAAGVYFYRLATDEFTSVKKMILIK